MESGQGLLAEKPLAEGVGSNESLPGLVCLATCPCGRQNLCCPEARLENQWFAPRARNWKLKRPMTNRVPYLFLLTALAALFAGGCGHTDAPKATADQQPLAAAPVETALVISEESAARLDPTAKFLLGLEREVQNDYPHLREKRIAVITHKNSIDTRGHHSLEYFVGNERFTLSRVALIDDGTGAHNDIVDEALGPPGEVAIFEFNADFYDPADAFYDGLDMVVFDAALPGPRFAVESAVLGAALEGAALHRVQFLVLDRPLRGNNSLIEGPTTDAQTVGSREAFLPVPVYTALTPGELATLYNGHFGIQGDLQVVEMSNWNRAAGSDWLRGEPLWQVDKQERANLKSIAGEFSLASGYSELKSAADMARQEDWEVINLRRGESAIELVLRSKEVEPAELLDRLAAFSPAGVELSIGSVSLSIGDVPAVVVSATSPREIRPVELSLALRYAALADSSGYPTPESLGLYATNWMYEGLRREISPADLARSWQQAPAYETFIEERRKVLRYEP